MIRDCETKDIPAIVEMARSFWQYTIFKDEEFQEEVVEEMIKKCMADNLCLVFDAEGKTEGFVCGIKGYLLANIDVMSGTEIAWWVNENCRSGGEGLMLLKSIEKRAKDIGIKYWNMAFMDSSMPAKIKSIYENMGYALNETIYTRVF